MTSLAEWNTAPARRAGSASVLDRIIAILDAVRESRGSISITELAARTALPKSTVSRLVAAMIQQRYLERTEDGVTLGLRLFELGARASVPRRLIAAAGPPHQKPVGPHGRAGGALGSAGHRHGVDRGRGRSASDAFDPRRDALA